jgi:hypothetical protein
MGRPPRRSPAGHVGRGDAHLYREMSEAYRRSPEPRAENAAISRRLSQQHGRCGHPHRWSASYCASHEGRVNRCGIELGDQARLRRWRATLSKHVTATARRHPSVSARRSGGGRTDVGGVFGRWAVSRETGASVKKWRGAQAGFGSGLRFCRSALSACAAVWGMKARDPMSSAALVRVDRKAPGRQ